MIPPISTQHPVSHALPIPSASAPLGVGAHPSSIASLHAPQPSQNIFFQAVSFFKLAIFYVLSSIQSVLDLCIGIVKEKEEEDPDAWRVAELEPAEAPVAAPPALAGSTPSLSGSPVPRDPFSTLPMSSEEKRKLYKIIHTVGTHNLIALGLKSGELNRLGGEIDSLHPLKFIEFIILHPTLREDAKTIRADSWKWPQFINPFKAKMDREGTARLLAFLPGFARSFRVSIADLRPFFESRRWEDMVRFLIDAKTGVINSVYVAPVEPIPAPVSSTTETVSPPGETTVSAPADLTPPPPREETAVIPSPFAQTKISDPEKMFIGDLFNCYTNHSYWSLLWRESDRLKDLWYRLDQVCPLRLLSHIFTTPLLSQQLKTITSSRATNYFFSSKLIELLARKELTETLSFADDFATELRLDPRNVHFLIRSNRWDMLISYIQEAQESRLD